MVSLLDRTAAAWMGRRRLFEGGWGDRLWLDQVAAGAIRFDGAPAAKITWSRPGRRRGLEITDGAFLSPCQHLPASLSTAFLRRVRPLARPVQGSFVVLASSREEGYRQRHWIWDRFIRQGYAGYYLENPYYGRRAPAGQKHATIPTVSEHLLMNLASVAEASAILETLAAEDCGDLGIAGFSMGAFMAAITAAVTRRKLAVAVIAGGVSPLDTFTRSAFSAGVALDVLADLEGTDPRERLNVFFSRGATTCYPPPIAPEAAVIVSCRNDGFVAQSQGQALTAHWPGAKWRLIPGGHVGAVIWKGAAHRAALGDAFTALASHHP